MPPRQHPAPAPPFTRDALLARVRDKAAPPITNYPRFLPASSSVFIPSIRGHFPGS
jgi:hypothetical protein